MKKQAYLTKKEEKFNIIERLSSNITRFSRKKNIGHFQSFFTLYKYKYVSILKPSIIGRLGVNRLKMRTLSFVKYGYVFD